MFKMKKILWIMMALLATQMSADECVSTEIELGSTLSGSWDTNCSTTQGDGRYAKFYTFELDTNESVVINLESMQDTYLILFSDTNQAGTVLEEDDDGGEGTNSKINTTLNAGTYTIEVTTFGQSIAGDFNLSIATTIIEERSFSGIVTLPNSITNLLETCSANSCPSISISFYGDANGATSVDYNDTSGQYEYTISLIEFLSETDEEKHYNVEIYIENGNLGNESLYYDFGADYAIGISVDINDSNDAITRDNSSARSLRIFGDQSTVVLDIDLSSKDEGYSVISGTVRLPSGNYSGVNVQFYNNEYSYSRYTDANSSYAYSFLIPEEEEENIESTGLNVKINAYSNTTSFSTLYSFGADNAVGGTGENADHTVDKCSNNNATEPIMFDFSSPMPFVDINLSSYVAPLTSNVEITVMIPEGIDNLEFSLYDLTCRNAVNDISGYSHSNPDGSVTYGKEGLRVGHEFGFSIDYSNNDQWNSYILNDDDSNFTNGGVFLGAYEWNSSEGKPVFMSAYTATAEDAIFSPFEFITSENPVITLLGDNPQTLELGSVYVELNATTDDSSIITIDISAVDMNTVGVYNVTYNAIDASQNQAIEVTRTVIVEDTTAPIITLLGNNPQTLERGSEYVELNATTDDSTAIIIDDSEVDMNTVGEYNVSYNATDISQNQAVEITRTVIVEDTTAPSEPTLTRVGDIETIDSSIIIEINGEVGTIVYVNDVNVTNMRSDGKVSIEFLLEIGNNTFDIKLVDTYENESTILVIDILRLLDTDNDGVADKYDDDDDNDGVLDYNDDLPLNPNESVDTDGDGTGNKADRDDDNDGISDVDENKWGLDPLDASDGGDTDSDHDGVSNADEIEAGSDPFDSSDTKKPKKFVPIMMDDLIIMVPSPD